MKFTDTLDHFCVHGARLNIHRPPELVTCGNAECGQGAEGEHKFHLSHANAAKLGVDLDDPKCPQCGEEMKHSGPRHFGELHLTICLDDRIHMPERLRKGEITVSEFETWRKTLTERELNGYFDHRTHGLVVKLDPFEVELFEQNPTQCVDMLMPKIKARLELDAQFQIQHRSVVTQHDVTHLFKHVKK